MIGVDPHKGSHTAVVTDQAEMVLGQVRVRACAVQAERRRAGAAADVGEYEQERSQRAQPLPVCSAGGSRDPSEVVAAELVPLVPAARDQRLRNRPAAALT